MVLGTGPYWNIKRQRSPLLLVIIFLIGIFPIATQSQANTLETIHFSSSNPQHTNPRTWSNVSLLYPNQYHNYSQLLDELNQIANTTPSIVDLFTIGKGIQGNNIYCLRITNEVNTDPKAGTVILSHNHGREMITIEISLRFIIRLVNGYGIDQAITEYINSEEIFFIPTLNPDSLQYVVDEGNAWLRKNLRSFDDDSDGQFDEDPPDDVNLDGKISSFDIYEKYENGLIYIDSYFEGIDNDQDGLVNEDNIGGVDLNRNYDYKWNSSLSDSGWGSDTTTEDYPGTAPFSEPETQAFRDFMENKTFATAISLHSGINATYFPWAYTRYWLEQSLYYEIYNDFLNLWPNLEDYLSGGSFDEKSSQRSLPSYTVAGSWEDWMYDRKDCLVPMTYEIYHNTSSNTMGILIDSNSTHEIYQWDKIFPYFAPVESAIDALWDDVQPTFDYWLELVPRIAITSYTATGGKNEGETLKVNIIIKNLSPRVTTAKWLHVMDKDFEPLLKNGVKVTLPAIAAAQTRDFDFEFDLEQTLEPGNNYTIKIGSEFVGFVSLIIEEDQIGTQISTNSTPWGLFPTILAIATLLVWGKVKRR